MARFFVDAADVQGNIIYIRSKEDIKHISKVLRMKEGDKLEISDCSQWEYDAQIEFIEQDVIELSVINKQEFEREPQVRVTLFQGIPKQAKMETIVQKCVELGIDSIVPVFMDRTVVVDKGNFGKKIQRWQKVSDEAVKQCKRGIIPEVSDSLKTKEAIEQFDEFDLVLFPYENEEGKTIKDELKNCGDVKNIAVIIGPEGGFSDEEAELIVAAGGKSVSLGKTTLRTETAGMAAIAMIMYELEL
jgi:16S rRNA (uracil1498-N3)-methyltransferase